MVCINLGALYARFSALIRYRQVELRLVTWCGAAGLFHLGPWSGLGCWAGFDRREGRLGSSAARVLRLLASTAAATNSPRRSAPSGRQRLMPRPRSSTALR